MDDVFSSDHLRSADRFAAWRERFWPVLGVHPLDDGLSDFSGVHRVWRIGPLAFTHSLLASPVRIVRHERQARRDSVDHWFLLSASGERETRLRIADQCLTVRPGAPVIASTVLPKVIERRSVHYRVLYLPRSAAAPMANALDAALGCALDSPFGRMLDDLVVSFDQLLPTMSDQDRQRLPPVILALLSAAIAAMTTPPAPALRAAADLSRRERVRRLIRSNLGSHRLTPRQLCRMSGLSRSVLYRLFEGQGGVASVIQSERLRAAHSALSDPHDRRTIQAIAEACAFADGSTFSRAFRAEFGCTPTEVRLAASAGAINPIAQHDGPAAKTGPGDFARLLRDL